ncbi:helix-turn-helix domain-containing protein [Rufibacter hautae]|uniref:Helix-turn-helix transcriptional regulator n=1 Tax=Rufibacter hautae TaxID=2595005 RepID=A0A5B6TDJ2_9BACT|nr:helix-turn-helix transcriptional regulator [Rufibacter hautae]KAA3437084.1 helix-turn-helix transcriptional regulator [Rufibacter hautae]
MPPLGVKYPKKIELFGDHLRRLRERKGFSQQALADTADITKITVLRIENGRNAPTLDILLSLSEALEIPLSELMKFDEDGH